MPFGTSNPRIPTSTIIGLPAFPLSAEMYQTQATLSDQIRWLNMDYPGIGTVPLASEEIYSMEFLADRVLALLDAAQCSSAVIMGTSMGGYVAMALWRKAPERIRGLILADTRADADAPEMAERRRSTVQDLRAKGVNVLRERLRQLFSEATRALHPEWIEAAQHRL
jgi:pimeloyl-ACP methyl ester carboxylesterase